LQTGKYENHFPTSVPDSNIHYSQTQQVRPKVVLKHRQKIKFLHSGSP